LIVSNLEGVFTGAVVGSLDGGTTDVVGSLTLGCVGSGVLVVGAVVGVSVGCDVGPHDAKPETAPNDNKPANKTAFNFFINFPPVYILSLEKVINMQ
jgi:hypothetical protein